MACRSIGALLNKNRQHSGRGHAGLKSSAVQEKSGFVPNVFLALARRPAEWHALHVENLRTA